MKKRKLLLLALAAFAVVGGWLLCAAVLPESPVATVTFHAIYSISSLRPSFMRLYSRDLRWRHGGYIPEEIDSFLCDRLLTASPDEFSAIVTFYIEQSGDRPGSHLGSIPEQIKIKAIGAVIERFDHLDDPAKLRAILLVEYLRLDGDIQKPEFIDLDRLNEQGQRLQDSEAVEQAAILYRNWWQGPMSWQEKKQISPLDGSGLSILSP
jgi:hypothetical protein